MIAPNANVVESERRIDNSVAIVASRVCNNMCEDEEDDKRENDLYCVLWRTIRHDCVCSLSLFM